MNHDALTELQQFFGAYFHQDWILDANSPDDIVRRFISDGCSNDELIHLAATIDRYAASKEGDVVAEEGLLKELWCYYLPSADGRGAREWLRHVAQLLRDSASQQRVFRA